MGSNLYAYVRCNPLRFMDQTGNWTADMHFAAVYWTGRMAGVEHEVALRVALASQSPDDFPETHAPTEKAATFTSSDPGGRRMATINNMHALNINREQSQVVARLGIAKKDDLLFGLGLHTVGDRLPHGQLGGPPTFGHQTFPNENGSFSFSVSGDADQTSKNPRKAFATIRDFKALWGNSIEDTAWSGLQQQRHGTHQEIYRC